MKTALKLKLASLVLISSVANVDAAEWLILQGMQPDNVSPYGVKVPYRSKKPKVWGFIQANYKQDEGSIQKNAAGVNLTPFSLLNPDLKGQQGLNLFRARIAMRGMADNDNKVNYFFMTEFGNNGINNLAGHREIATYFTDASVTLKHIKGAKVRAGMFKTPSSEEGLAAVFVAPYIEFTSMTFQQMLERQITNVGAAQGKNAGTDKASKQAGAKAAGGASSIHYTSTSLENPIAAFRDVGIQVFDTFKLPEKWQVSYAYMYGNGAGVSENSANTNETHYGYLSVEKLFKHPGRGYYTNSFKMFAWANKGKRLLLSKADAASNVVAVNANRTRYGLGFTYHKSGLRFEAEYMVAEGMIYTGAKDKNSDPSLETWQFQYAIGDENKADGGYVNLQYEIVPRKFEVFGRYDYMNRLTNDVKGQRDFTTLTLGWSYRFKGATRLDFNYLIRDAKAPGNANAQKVLDNMGNRLAFQLTAGF